MDHLGLLGRWDLRELGNQDSMGFQGSQGSQESQVLRENQERPDLKVIEANQVFQDHRGWGNQVKMA